MCKECENLQNNLENSDLDKIYCNYRRMGTDQLERFYGKGISGIKYILDKNNYITNKNIINSNLSKEEVIFMYRSLLNGDIKKLSNGFFKNNNSKTYVKYIFKYLINDILEWNRDDICSLYCNQICIKYKLGAIQTCMGLGVYDILNIIFPEYDIKEWELKKSSTIWNENKLNVLKSWLLDKLSKREVSSIVDIGIQGTTKIVQGYNLGGIVAQKFGGSSIKFFEFIFEEKYKKEEIIKNNFKFKTNATFNIERKLENTIYNVTNLYNALDDMGKTLINEVIRFCEENEKFPLEKEMCIKNGYIPRTQFYKYFNCKNFGEVYKYITPVDNGTIGGGKKKLVKAVIIKPSKIECTKCGIEKPFTIDYFCKGINNKYGLKYICKQCATEEAAKKFYANKGIYYNDIQDISPSKWHEYFLLNTINIMPKFCYIEENEIEIIKHIIIEHLKCVNKNEIINRFNTNAINKYRVEMMISRLGGKLVTLQKSFPEYNFVEEDFDIYSEIKMCKIISNWIDRNRLSVQDILTKSFIECNKDVLTKNDIVNLVAARFASNNELFLWYFNYNKIKHPYNNREINIYDFKLQPHMFWSKKEHRIKRIQMYCEYECEENILNIINNTEKLKKWVYKYFKQENINKMISSYNYYVDGLYGLLIESYPCIKDNKILFDWEWHILTKYDKNTLQRMLRELVIYRLNGLIINQLVDIPRYLNRTFLKEMFPKFNKHILRKRFKSCYDWACFSFPEYTDQWTKEDFGHILSIDNIEFDSYQEKDLYEFIKKNDLLQHIKPVGRKKLGEYTFELGEDYEYERFCPDFVIEHVNMDNKKIKLKKPIIIEYYGMFVKGHSHPIYQKYYAKTLVKEKYYKSNKNIYYIGIFPNDIKNNYEGLKNKLKSFLHVQYN